jgi:hypothetical protein
MYRIAIVLVAVMVLASPSWAACDEDTIETISSDGDLILLSNGQSYDVLPGHDVTASLWNEGDDVLVCGDTIIHKDDGEQVDVTLH